MAAPYSEDLRRKIVQACERGTQSQREVATIEPCWSKLKTGLRGMTARTRAALDLALTKIISKISNSDTRGWFAHCGYPIR